MLLLNQHHLMKRGTEPNAVLRDDRKVVSPVDSSIFIGSAAFTASVFEAVFLCPVGSARLAESGTHLRIF
ncbi:hypothetical protein [Hymenobacter canadensis]|uniref:Uncharacterized protein n=1 Tax=Hymenobacter canadensis TaxID=2999067 RepID=A0ABY7LMU9_9BACT|nr:hypothetical protein [Hymenobacter canadensis]WBA40777.1 hypothetical protein O3303_13210 [Hymenobacter canadensis]